MLQDVTCRLSVFAVNTGSILLLFLALIGPGRLVLRAMRLKFDSPAGQYLHALALGFGVVSLLLYFLGIAGFFRMSVIVAVLGAGLAAGLAEAPTLVHEGAVGLRRLTSWAFSPGTGRFERCLAAALGGYLLLLFARCFLPVVHTDALGYQLAEPQQWLFEGRVVFLPTHLTSELPAGVWMLYAAVTGLLGWERGAAACQLVDFGFFLAGLSAVALAVDRLVAGGGDAGGGAAPHGLRCAPLWAVALYATTAGVAYWSIQPYTAAPSTFFLILGLDWLSRWVARPLDGPRPVVMAGLMGGLAAFCKVHGGVFAGAAGVLIVAGLVRGVSALRRSEDGLRGAGQRRRRGLLLFAAPGLYLLTVTLIAAPWFVRSWLETGNPVFPVADGIFHSPHYAVSGRDIFAPGAQHPAPPWMIVGFLWEYADNNRDPQQVIGPAWLLAVALAFVQWRRLSRASRAALWLALFYSAVFCLLRANVRYANVLMAVLALPAAEAAALALARLAGGGRRLPAVALGALLGALLTVAAMFVFRVNDLDSLSAQTRMTVRCWGRPEALDEYAEALGDEATTTTKLPTYEARMAARRLIPPDGRVLLAGIGRGYLLQRRHYYDSDGQVLVRFRDPGGAKAVARRLADLGVEWIIWPEPDIREDVSHKRIEKLYKYWSDPAYVEFAEKYTEVVVRTPDATLRRLVPPSPDSP